MTSDPKPKHGRKADKTRSNLQDKTKHVSSIISRKKIKNKGIHARNKGKSPSKRRKEIYKALDKTWGLLVRKRYNNRCAWPGCTNLGNQPHHFFNKAQGLHARWSVDNGICLCFAHHIYQVHGKGDTEPIRDVMIARLGQDGFDNLKASVKQVWKPTLNELEELLKKLKAELES